MKRWLMLLICAPLFAQSLIDIPTQTKNPDFSAFAWVRPWKVGTVLPATCTVGDAFFKSNGPLGQKLYGCDSTNVWALQGGGGGGTVGIPTGGAYQDLSDASKIGTGAGQVAAGDDSRITGAMQKAQNLNDVADKATARSNLQLGDVATRNVGTGAGTAAAGDDSRITGAAQKSANLSDLGDHATSRTNLDVPKRDGTGATGTWPIAITGNAATATQFAVSPSDCGVGTFATGIAADGTPHCSVPPGGGDVIGVTSSVEAHFAAFNGATGKEIKDTGYSPGSFVQVGGSYSDPVWLTGLAWSKISGAPSTYAPAAHAADHAQGGADPITGTMAANVTGSAGALATNPAACPTGEFTNDMDADGTLHCATPAGSHTQNTDEGTTAVCFQLSTLAAGAKICAEGTGVRLYTAAGADAVLTVDALNVTGAVQSYTGTRAIPATTPNPDTVFYGMDEVTKTFYVKNENGAIGYVPLHRPCSVTFHFTGSSIADNKTAFAVVPGACTLTRWDLRADQALSATVEIERANYATWDGTLSGASIVGAGTKPSVTAAKKAQDLDLSGDSWTSLALVAGDTVEAILSSVTVGSATDVTLVLIGERPAGY